MAPRFHFSPSRIRQEVNACCVYTYHCNTDEGVGS